MNTTPQTDSLIFDDVKPLPVLYSQKAIYACTVLFGSVFGAVMMAMNFEQTENKQGKWQVILFGVLFMAGQFALAQYLPRTNSSYAILCGIIAGQIYKVVFWNKFIGANVRYEKRSIVMPAIIGICLIAVLIGLMFLELKN